MLATLDDVADRLGRDLTQDEIERIDGLLAEAGALVTGYLGHTPDPVPDQVVLVVSRMAARVLQSPGVESGSAESVSYTAGPFSQSFTLASGASGGSPWLTISDKVILKPFRRRRRGIYSLTFG